MKYDGDRCTNCQFFTDEHGLQRDGMGWSNQDCDNGVVSGCMDIDFSKMVCEEHKRLSNNEVAYKWKGKDN